MEEKEQPLVSVRVITYNSSKTIIETLDSIYNQTYPNIELIISDDCSKDDTIAICREWVNKHEERFVRTELVTVPQNTGVSANVNRSEKACRGEWIKGIAGDDILLPHCISTFVSYVNEHPEVEYVFSKIKCFGGSEERRNKMETFFNYEFFEWTPEQQYEFLTLERNCIPSLGSFYNREAIINKHGIICDERIPLIDDWPRWINLLKSGIHMYFIDDVLSLYRMSDNALSSQTTQTTTYNKSYALVYKYYGFKNDFKKRSKKDAVYKYLRNEKLLHDNGLFWAIVCKLYKLIILHRL